MRGPCSSRCATAIAPLLALLLSPKILPADFYDNAFEALMDTLSPLQVLAPPPGAASAPFHEILPARKPFCPVVYKSCEVQHSFAPRESDVIITTPPKTGTTFLQQMTHQLRSGGDMNFTDLYDVSPWILVNPLYRGDAADVVQPGSPRLFKSHQSLAEMRGGRHIVVMRDPAKVLQSWYSFARARELPFVRHNGYLHIAASLLGLPQRAAEWWLGATWKDEREFIRSSLGWRRDMAFGVNIHQYIAEFWHARRDPNVLLLCYEDLASDRERWIPLVGRFLGVDVSPELLKRVFEMTSKEFMLSHAEKFDESQIADAINRNARIQVPWVASPKVMKTEYRELSPDALALLQREWLDQAAPSTGFNTYGEMRRAWREEMTHLHGI